MFSRMENTAKCEPAAWVAWIQNSATSFPSPFLYLADSDPKDTQVFYFGVKNKGPESAGDEGWRQGLNMVIFSYRRDEDKRAYTGTDAVCVFGFHPKAAGHKAIFSFIEVRVADPFTAPESEHQEQSQPNRTPNYENEI